MTMALVAAAVVGAPPSAMVWRWGGAGLAAAARGGGAALAASGATPEAPASFGAGTRVEEATTNLLANPSFEVDTAGWNLAGASSLIRITTQAMFGSASGEVVAPSDQNGVRHSFTSLASTTYAISAWVRGTAGTVRIAHYDVVNATKVSSAAVTLTTTWQRISVVATTGAGGTDSRVYIETPPGAGPDVTFQIDGVQAERTDYATSYCDGSLGTGYSWSGTAHASTASRAAGRLRASAAGCNAARGAVALWWRPDAGAAHPADRTLLRWGSGDAYLDLTYRAASDRFELTMQAAAGSADSVQSAVQTFAAGDAIAVVACWDERSVAVAAGEATAVRAARTAPIAVIGDAQFDLGAAGTSAQAAGALGPVIWFERPLSPAEVSVLARMARAPRWQEVA